MVRCQVGIFRDTVDSDTSRIEQPSLERSPFDDGTQLVFMARAREDASFVRKVSASLTKWSDRWRAGPEIPERDAWEADAEAAIAAASAMVFVGSSFGFRSLGCRHEVSFALALPQPPPIIHLALMEAVADPAQGCLDALATAMPTVLAQHGDADAAAADLVRILCRVAAPLSQPSS